MTDEQSGTLKELQDLDLDLESLRARITEFEPLLAEVEEPALALEQEVTTLQGRLQEMRLEERRLERAADDRRARLKALKERQKSVRNLREEAAVQAEFDLLQRSLEGEEQEALTLLDQIRKLEERLEEAEEALQTARAEVDPRRTRLLEEERSAQEELGRLEEKRETYASRVPAKELRSYERIRGGGRSVAVATLTPDGACGHCFGMVPLQVQNEIRSGKALIPCQSCGVLLGAGDPKARG
jgi:predicted  nucleic acid-binding Zn-ribbon protein